MATGGKLRLEEGTGGGTHVGFKAPDTEVTNELLWTLPDTDGSSGQALVTDGNKNLSFADTGDLVAEVTLSSAQILNIHTTDVELIPAPTDGTAILVTQIQSFVDFNTTAYDSGYNGINIRHPGGALLASAVKYNHIEATSDKHFIVSDGLAGGIELLANTSVVAFAGGAITLGDSPIKLKIYYKKVVLLV